MLKLPAEELLWSALSCFPDFETFQTGEAGDCFKKVFWMCSLFKKCNDARYIAAQTNSDTLGKISVLKTYISAQALIDTVHASSFPDFHVCHVCEYTNVL